jgi:hypothetical protein
MSLLLASLGYQKSNTAKILDATQLSAATIRKDVKDQYETYLVWCAYLNTVSPVVLKWMKPPLATDLRPLIQ